MRIDREKLKDFTQTSSSKGYSKVELYYKETIKLYW